MPVLFWQCDHFMGVNIHIKYPKSKSNRSLKKIITHVIYRVTPQFCSFFYNKNNIVVMLLNNCSGEHGVFLALCTRCKPAGVCLPSVSSCTRPLVSKPKQTGYCNMLRSRTVCYRKYRIQQRAVCIWHVRRRVSPQRTEKIVVHCYTIYIFLIIAVLQEIKHQNRTTHKISVGKHRCATIKNQTE